MLSTECTVAMSTKQKKTDLNVKPDLRWSTSNASRSSNTICTVSRARKKTVLRPLRTTSVQNAPSISTRPSYKQPDRLRTTTASHSSKAEISISPFQVHGEAKVADLCAQDKQKIGSLIRKVIALRDQHDEKLKSFETERAQQSSAVKRLSKQNRVIMAHTTDVRKRFQNSLTLLRGYRERLKVVADEEHKRVSEVRSASGLQAEVDTLRVKLELTQQQLHDVCTQLSAPRETRIGETNTDDGWPLAVCAESTRTSKPLKANDARVNDDDDDGGGAAVALLIPRNSPSSLLSKSTQSGLSTMALLEQLPLQPNMVESNTAFDEDDNIIIASLGNADENVNGQFDERVDSDAGDRNKLIFDDQSIDDDIDVEDDDEDEDDDDDEEAMLGTVSAKLQRLLDIQNQAPSGSQSVPLSSPQSARMLQARSLTDSPTSMSNYSSSPPSSPPSTRHSYMSSECESLSSSSHTFSPPNFRNDTQTHDDSLNAHHSSDVDIPHPHHQQTSPQNSSSFKAYSPSSSTRSDLNAEDEHLILQLNGEDVFERPFSADMLEVLQMIDNNTINDGSDYNGDVVTKKECKYSSRHCDVSYDNQYLLDTFVLSKMPPSVRRTQQK